MAKRQPVKDYIGCDTETDSGKAILITTPTRHAEVSSWRECMTFLFDHEGDDFVFFNMNYDARAVCSYLPKRALKELDLSGVTSHRRWRITWKSKKSVAISEGRVNKHGEWRGTRFHSRTRYGDPSQCPQLVIKTLEGLPANRPPRLEFIGNRTGSEGQLLRFTISAVDPDPDDTLSFTAANLPSGAAFHAPTANFSWVPDYDQAGNYPDVEFAVMDDGDPLEVDAELIAISIGNVNRPPVFVPVAPQEVLENQSISFRVEATDPDGEEKTS